MDILCLAAGNLCARDRLAEAVWQTGMSAPRRVDVAALRRLRARQFFTQLSGLSHVRVRQGIATLVALIVRPGIPQPRRMGRQAERFVMLRQREFAVAQVSVSHSPQRVGAGAHFARRALGGE